MPNVCQAVPIPPNQVFLSKGYGQGATLLQLDRAADAALAVHVVWADRKVMKTKFSNVTVQNGYVYGLSDGILECIEVATGLSPWKEGRYGHGQLLRRATCCSC